MTGELEPIYGNVYVNGFDVRMHLNAVRQNLGYCSQDDRLIDYLSVRETLELFASLRGVPSELIAQLIDNMMAIFDLSNFDGTLVKNLRYAY